MKHFCNPEHTCPRCGGPRIYRKCEHGCDGKTPEDVRRERRARRTQKLSDAAAKSSVEPKTMTRVYAMGEEWFGHNRFTVWISNAGRTRHIAVRVKRGVMVEGVGPTWLEAFQDAVRLRKKHTAEVALVVRQIARVKS